MPEPTTQPVFSRAELLAAGWAPERVAAEVRSGRWVRQHRGQYSVAERLPAHEHERAALRVLAASRATAVDVVGSHESAAQVHGLALLEPYDGPVVLSRVRGPEATWARRGALKVSAVPPGHRTATRVGAPVTTVARTAADLARRDDPRAGLAVLDSAQRRGVSVAALQRVIDDCAGWPGIAHVRDLLPLATPLAETALESLVRWCLVDGGLPPPELQVVVHDRPEVRVDFCWRAQRVVCEADGLFKYDDLAVLRREKLRQELLEQLGWTVFRVLWAEAMADPGLVVARARDAFARAALRARRDG